MKEDKLPKDNRELKRISEKPDMVEGILSTCKVCGQKTMGLFARHNKKEKYKIVDIVLHTCCHIKEE